MGMLQGTAPPGSGCVMAFAKPGNIRVVFSAPLRFKRLSAVCRTSAASSPQSQSSSSTINDASTNDFVEWARRVGVSFSKLAPAKFEGVRGMKAVAAIEADEVIVSVPREFAITLAPKQRCPFPEFVAKDFWDSSPWFVKVALMLLHERMQPNSRLQLYLNQLPNTVDVPVLWEDSKLQLLQYPYLIHAVKEQQLEWAALYEQLKTSGLQPGKSVSKQSFYWAISCVRSRTFSGPYVRSTLRERVRLAALVGALVLTNATLEIADFQQSLSAAIAVFLFNILYEVILSQKLKQYAMCPLIDFINHSSSEKAEVSYDYFTDRYSVATSCSYQPGEQVFINYGENQSNDSLMQYYGFSEVDNPADVYVMTNLLKVLDQDNAPEHKRLEELNSSGLLGSLQLVSVVREGFPGPTLQALRFLLASEEEAAAGIAHFAQPGSADVEARVAQILINACMRELEAMGTGLQEDVALLTSHNQSSMSREERSAVAFRIEKKKVLHACLRNLGVTKPEPSLTRTGSKQGFSKAPVKWQARN